MDATVTLPVQHVPNAFGRAVGIMWLRQMKRFSRSRSRIIAALAQPVLFLVAFGFGFGPVFSQAGQGSYIQFLAPGIVGMTIVFAGIFSGIEVMWDRQFGFLKETLVAPVPRLAIMLGRTLGGATVSVIQGVLVLAVTLAIGFRPENWLLLPLALVPMALVALMFTAVGTAAGTIIRDMQGFPLVMNFIVMPLFFLSGALFPLDGLPAAMGWVIAFNPLAYGVDAIRALLIGASHYGLWLDFAVLLGVVAVVLWFGAARFRKIEA